MSIPAILDVGTLRAEAGAKEVVIGTKLYLTDGGKLVGQLFTRQTEGAEEAAAVGIRSYGRY